MKEKDGDEGSSSVGHQVVESQRGREGAGFHTSVWLVAAVHSHQTDVILVGTGEDMCSEKGSRFSNLGSTGKTG